MFKFAGYLVYDNMVRVVNYSARKTEAVAFCVASGLPEANIRRIFVKDTINAGKPMVSDIANIGPEILEPNEYGLLVPITKEENV
jgi:hypothetical protein